MAEEVSRLDSLLQVLLTIGSPGDRSAFIEKECGGDSQLRRELEEMLRTRVSGLNSVSYHDPGHSTQDGATYVPEEGQSAPSGLSSSDAATECRNVQDESHESDYDNEKILEDGGSILSDYEQTLGAVPRVQLVDPADEGEAKKLRPRTPGLPNRTSDGRYVLLGELARGGMGSVLKGRDIDLGRDLAIKVLLDSHKDRPEVIQRFIEEAQIGGQLQHPGIAPVYELGKFEDNRPFFTMKLVRGETLSALLSQRKDVHDDRSRFLGIFEQICQTMAYVHTKGVIHRDLKPSNIMVGAFGEVQVMDWGLAKVLVGIVSGGVDYTVTERPADVGGIQTVRTPGSSTDWGTGSHTQTGSVLGTPAYMPPEQAQGETSQLDRRSDVFGLGAILCEILTGKPPYVGKDSGSIFRLASSAKLEDCYRRLAECRADPALIEITRDCLQPDPQLRPADATALLARITGYLESVASRLKKAETEQATQAVRLEQQHQAAQRMRKVLIALAAVASITLIACLFATFSQLQASASAREAQRLENVAKNNAREAQNNAVVAQQREGEAVRAKEASERSEVAARKSEQEARDSEAIARQVAYATDMQLFPLKRKNVLTTAPELMQLLDAHDPAKQPVNEHRPDLRGFEWYYYRQLLVEGSIETGRLRNQLAGFAVTATGTPVSIDHHLRVESWPAGPQQWSTEPGQWMGELPSAIRTKVLSPRGTYIGLAGPQSAQVRKANSGELVWEKTFNNTIASLEFTADESQLGVGFSQRVEILASQTGETLRAIRLHSQEGGRPGNVFFSPNGRVLGVTSRGPYGNFTEIIDLDRPVEDATSNGVIADMGGTVGAAALNTDGSLLFVGSSYVGTFFVFDAKTGEQRMAILNRHPSGITAFGVSSDNRLLASADSAGMIHIWKNPNELTPTAQPSKTLRGHLGSIESLQIREGNRSLVSADSLGVIRTWTLAKDEAGVTSQDFNTQRFPTHRVAPQYMVGGLLLAAVDVSGTHVVIRDAWTGRVVQTLAHGGPIQSLAVAPRGDTLAVGRRELISDRYPFAEVWTIATGKRLCEFSGLTGETYNTSAYHNLETLAFSKDGKTLFGGFGSSTSSIKGVQIPIKIWNIPLQREDHSVLHHGNACVAATFSPDGTLLATASHDNTVALWNPRDWQAKPKVISLDQSGESLAFSPDGTTLAVGTQSSQNSGDVYLIDLAADGTATSQRRIPRAHFSGVSTLQFSADGRSLVSGGYDQAVRIWSVATLRELHNFNTPEINLGGVTAVLFNPQGTQLLATGRESRSTVVWNHSESIWNNPDDVARVLSNHIQAGGEVRQLVRWLAHQPSLSKCLASIPIDHADLQTARLAARLIGSARDASANDCAKVYDDFRAATSDRISQWLSPSDLHHIALALLKSGQFFAAAQAIAHNADWTFRETHFNQSQRDELIEALQSAVTIMASPDVDLVQVALCTHEVESEKCLEAIEKALSQRADSTDQRQLSIQYWLLQQQANAFATSGKYEAAIESLSKIGEGDPASWNARTVQRAELWEKMGSLSNSVEQYQKLFEKDPTQYLALVRCIERMERAGAITAANEARNFAIAQLEALWKQDPTNELLASTLSDLLLSHWTDPWKLFKPKEFVSVGGATLTLQDDQTLLSSDASPDYDTYRLRGSHSNAGSIRGILIEAFSDPSLPARGPGRGAKGRMLMTRMVAMARSSETGEKPVRLLFDDAASDVRDSVSPQFARGGHWIVYEDTGKPHHMAVRVAGVPEAARTDTLSLRLEFLSRPFLPHTSLGRFRVATTTDPRAVENIRIRNAARSRSDVWFRFAVALELGQRKEALTQLFALKPVLAEAVSTNREANRQPYNDMPAKGITEHGNSQAVLEHASRFEWINDRDSYSKCAQYAYETIQDDTHPLAIVWRSQIINLSRANPQEFYSRAQSKLDYSSRMDRDAEQIPPLLMTQALTHYRLQEHARAVEFADAAQAQPKVHVLVKWSSVFIKAMAIHAQGDSDKARDLATATAKTMWPVPESGESPMDLRFSADNSVLWLLFREAQQTIGFEIPEETFDD